VTLPRSSAIVLLIAVAAAAFSFRAVYEPDLWYHLAQGREFAAGHIVRENTFSFTSPDYRQRYAPWLFDVSMYGAWRVAGGAGVQAVQAFLLAAALALVYRAARVRASPAAAVAVLLAGLMVVEPRAIPRPNLVSFAGLALCMLVIERTVATGRVSRLWWSVPIVAIWSNLHVEAAFGPIVIGIFALAEFVRPSALSRRDAGQAMGIAAVCGIATVANPYGIGLWQYLIENTSLVHLLEIAELQPAYLPAYRAFFLYLIAAAVLVVLPDRSVRPWELAIVGLAAAIGMAHLRFTPLPFILGAPVVARHLDRLIARGLDRRAAIVTASALAIAGARVPITAVPSTWHAGTPAIEPAAFFSPRAIAFIRSEGLRGHLFNSNNLGGYLAFNLYPDARIFQDSRFQSYPPDHFRSILRASESPQLWTALVAGVDWAVLSRPRPDALSGVGRFPPAEWTTVFQDEAIEVVVRRAAVRRPSMDR
jgi:hypothetical protein